MPRECVHCMIARCVPRSAVVRTTMTLNHGPIASWEGSWKLMRILLAIHHFPPAYHGGAEWRAFRTANELQRQGHTVRVVSVETLDRPDVDGLSVRHDVFEGVAVDRLDLGLPDEGVPHQYRFHNAAIADYMSDLIADFDADVVHLIGGYLITAAVISSARAAGRPVVVTLTDFWFLCPRITLVRGDGRLCHMPDEPLECVNCLLDQWRRYRIVDRVTGGLSGRALIRWWRTAGPPKRGAPARWNDYVRARRQALPHLLGQASAVISPSRFLRDLYLQRNLRPEPFFYMRQGLETARWLPAERRADDGETFHVGYIGQLEPHKGVDVLIEAFRRLIPDSRRPVLHIYGDLGRNSRYGARIRRQTRNMENVCFEGVFPNREVRRIHAGLDVLVVPSVWYENSPTVILEAYASGTPVLVSDLGGMAELVEDGVSGHTFKTGDAAALASRLQRLMDDREALERLRAGLPEIKTVEQEVGELVSIYEQILAPSDVGGPFSLQMPGTTSEPGGPLAPFCYASSGGEA